MDAKIALFAICAIILVLTCGCTGTSKGSTDVQTEITPQTETPSTTVPTTAVPSVPQTIQTVPEPEETVQETATTISPRVVVDEGTAVYAGDYKVYDLCKETGDDFQYPGDTFSFELQSDKPLNILILKGEDEVGACETSFANWKGDTREWDYVKCSPYLQYDEITKKKFEYTVEKIGKYYLFLDGRVMPNDMTVMSDTARVDIKIVKNI